MKTTADTSVIVASFASWHGQHAIARSAIGRVDLVVAHCLLETYSVLTRLPAPHRMTADIVGQYLRSAFGRHALASLSASETCKLVASIAMAAMHAGAKLLTLDARARPIYLAFGVDHELVV